MTLPTPACFYLVSVSLNRFFIPDVISRSLFFFVFNLVTETHSSRGSQDSGVCLLTHSFFDSHCLVSDVCLVTFGPHRCSLSPNTSVTRVTRLTRQTEGNLLKTSVSD